MQKMQPQPLAENRALAELRKYKREETRHHIELMAKICPEAISKFITSRLVNRIVRVVRCCCSNCVGDDVGIDGYCVLDNVGDSFLAEKAYISSSKKDGMDIFLEPKGVSKVSPSISLREADESVFDYLCDE